MDKISDMQETASLQYHKNRHNSNNTQGRITTWQGEPKLLAAGRLSLPHTVAAKVLRSGHCWGKTVRKSCVVGPG